MALAGRPGGLPLGLRLPERVLFPLGGLDPPGPGGGARLVGVYHDLEAIGLGS